MATKKTPEMRENANRQIIPNAEDMDLFIWLEELFHLSPQKGEDGEGGVKPGEPKKEPDTFPEEVVLRPVFGLGARDWGEPLEQQQWKPMQSAIPQKEHLVQLANK